MTTSDIQAHIKDIYSMDISDTTVIRITDKILPEAREWQQRGSNRKKAVEKR